MKLFYIVLIIVILEDCNCSLLSCNYRFTEALFDKVECIQNGSESIENRSSHCRIDLQNITWEVIQSESGKVAVHFNTLPTVCKYELELYVNETLSNEDDCSKADFRNLPIRHSRRKVSIKDPQILNRRFVKSCEKVINVTFHHVYTGCYALGFQGENSQPMFLETAYTKDPLHNKTLSVAPQYLSHEKQLSISVVDSHKINITGILFRLDKCESYHCPCHNSYESEYRSWEIALTKSEDFMCKKTDNTILTCDIENGTIRCSIQNVTSGYYCLMTEFPYDERCLPNTVWTPESATGNICIYNTNFNLSAQSSQLSPPPDSSPEIWWFLVSVFTILSVIGICILLYFWKCKIREPKPGLTTNIIRQPSPLTTRILLLYPRDCKQFMKLMTIFRELLKTITKSEVCDCFDPERTEEIAANKEDWLRRCLSHPNVKVVVVESECSAVHQKVYFHHINVTYTEPTWLDHLFLHGLKALTDDLGKNTYQKVLVVRIQGFTEDKTALNHLTPYTRYVIPQHIETVLNALYQQSFIHDNIESSKQQLQEAIKNLENYKKQNPNYLDKLLRTNRICV